MKKVLVCGGGGFIGHHLASELMEKAHVIVADIKPENEYCDVNSYCDSYEYLDLRSERAWMHLDKIYGSFDEVYQLAADMGGAGYVFSGENDISIMLNSAQINIHCVIYACRWQAKVFYSSSACMYPSHNQEDPNNPLCTESSAYPANPDSEYGWEKLFSERLYLAAARNAGLKVSIARFHNIFGPEGTWTGGKEKAPAAITRKVIQAKDEVEIWGPGTQTRSFLYIDECVEGVIKLMDNAIQGPVNIGSDEMISINDLALMTARIAGKEIKIKNIPGPVGVMGRTSDNTYIKKLLNWTPKESLEVGMRKLYTWIKGQIDASNKPQG